VSADPAAATDADVGDADVGDGDGVSVCVVESVGDCQRHAADWRR